MESNFAGPELTALFSELVRLEVELWDAVEGRVRAEHAMALGSYEVMSVIGREPGCRVHDIAAVLSITVGGVSKIVDRVEAVGLCERRVNPGDRRSSIIELTAAGQRRLSEVTRTVEAELARLLAPAVRDRSLAEFTRMLADLRAAVRVSDPDQEAS